MIVTKNPKGWTIHFHRAHALLAFKIGIKLKSAYWPLPNYRLEGLSAITDHDSGQPKWRKQDNLTPAGAPLDFRQRDRTSLKEAKALVELCLYKSAFMTLMVSMHCCSLNQGNDEVEVKDFIKSQKSLQNRIIKNLGIAQRDAENCYLVLRFCDELSLLLCQGDIPKNGRKIQLEPLMGLPENFIFKDENDRLRLDTWCFESDEFTLMTEYYQTSQLEFASDQALISSIPLGEPEFLNFHFERSS